MEGAGAGAGAGADIIDKGGAEEKSEPKLCIDKAGAEKKPGPKINNFTSATLGKKKSFYSYVYLIISTFFYIQNSHS